MDPTAALAQGEQLLEQAAASHDPQALAAAIERPADAGEHILPWPDLARTGLSPPGAAGRCN